MKLFDKIYGRKSAEKGMKIIKPYIQKINIPKVGIRYILWWNNENDSETIDTKKEAERELKKLLQEEKRAAEKIGE